MSPHWRELSDDQQLVIKTTAQHLSDKIKVLHDWRDHGKLRDRNFSFVVTAPLVLDKLAILVKDLTSQVEFSALLL